MVLLRRQRRGKPKRRCMDAIRGGYGMDGCEVIGLEPKEEEEVILPGKATKDFSNLNVN